MAADQQINNSVGLTASSQPVISGEKGVEVLEKQTLRAVPNSLEARPALVAKKGKPKPLQFWNTSDVNKWLRKHGGLYYELYGELMVKHEITGRTLIKMNDIKLEKMGILDAHHRHDLLQFVLRLRLKHETTELRTLNQRGSGFELKLPDTRSQSKDKSQSSTVDEKRLNSSSRNN